MFRHERPQRGRFRQFHQFSVETFGSTGPDADAALNLIAARIWRRLGIDNIALEVNSLGNAASRNGYRERLRSHFSDHRDELDPESLRRLDRNPLRLIMDSKNPAVHIRQLRL